MNSIFGNPESIYVFTPKEEDLSKWMSKTYHVVKQNIFGNPERTVFICTPKEDNPIKLPLPQ